MYDGPGRWHWWISITGAESGCRSEVDRRFRKSNLVHEVCNEPVRIPSRDERLFLQRYPGSRARSELFATNQILID